MIKELELEIFRSEIPALRTFPDFEAPILHFATDPEADPERMLPCAIVTDHGNGTLELWSLHTQNNFRTAQEARNDLGFLFRHARNAQEAHCLVCCPDGTYLTFFEKSSIGIRFDPKNRRAFLFDTREAFGKDSGVESFGITAYENPDPDADFFYASCMRTAEKGHRQVLDVKVAYDFSYWEILRKDEGEENLRLNAPHMTRISGSRVYDSHFKDVSYSVPAFPGREISRHELVDSAMREIFRMFQKIAGLPEVETFEKHCRTEDGSVDFISDAFRIFSNRLRDSVNAEHLNDLICQKIYPGTVLLPGKISHFDVGHPDEIARTPTSKGSPAHFEFSKDARRVYVSSHNFDILCDALRYFGPAAIDAFDVENGKLCKRGTFETAEGYRFTSHRVFENGGKEYVATIGQPNRFYVVDAETLEKAFHTDLADSKLGEIPEKNLDSWVRSTHSDERYPLFRPFEISENGAFAYVPNKRGITYVSTSGPTSPKRFLSFELSGMEVAGKLSKLRAINAHCYRIRT